jgi:hypothetical protein
MRAFNKRAALGDVFRLKQDFHFIVLHARPPVGRIGADDGLRNATVQESQ